MFTSCSSASFFKSLFVVRKASVSAACMSCGQCSDLLPDSASPICFDAVLIKKAKGERKAGHA